MSDEMSKRELEVLEWVSGLQELDANDVIAEIVTSGYEPNEQLMAMREIAHNDSWQFERLKKEVRKIARAWVLTHGSDCDGSSSAGIVPCLNKKEAQESANGSAEWSDGQTYNVTTDWNEVKNYCDTWDVDSSKYEYCLIKK